MKLRDVVHLLGFRPPVRRYPSEIRTFELAREGRVQYAQWLHPGETPKVPDQAVVDHLRTFLSPGDVAIDIGAHTGDTALPMALALGPSGVVFALEPNPLVFEVLARNATLNQDKTSIVALNFAATSASGDYTFQYSDAGLCNGGLHARASRWRHGHAFRLAIRGENLQAYLIARRPDLVPRIRYVKVDAEGSDYDVLQSIEAIIAAQRPFLRVEVHKLTDRPIREALYDFLDSHGYALFRVASEILYRGPRLQRADVMNRQHYDLFGDPG